MDFVFPALQGIALAGLLTGLAWIVWERATHASDDAGSRDTGRGAGPQWRFVPPDPRDTLIVVAPPTDLEVVTPSCDSSGDPRVDHGSPPLSPDAIVAREPVPTDRGVVTSLQ